MKPTGESNTVVLPPALLTELEAAANEEHRPVEDMVRDFVERGLGERRWKAHSEQELRRARELGLPDADGQPMSDEYRQTVREKSHRVSAHYAKVKALTARVMAQMMAELGELEHQGHK